MRTAQLTAALLLLACTGRNPSEIVPLHATPDAVTDAAVEWDVPDAGPTLDDVSPPAPQADADDDGVPDYRDNCPYDDNPDQANLDEDANGGDACDPCPARGGDAESHADIDQDGFPFCARDCDDADPAVGPYSEDICDGRDNDCDFQVDEDEQGDVLRRQCYDRLTDRSSIGTCQRGVETCGDGEWSECIGAVYPEPEIPDGLDNDCDGETDEPAEAR